MNPLIKALVGAVLAVRLRPLDPPGILYSTYRPKSAGRANKQSKKSRKAQRLARRKNR